MQKNRIALKGISGVAKSKTALVELPVGPRYHYVVLQHSYTSGTNTIAAAATNVAEIRVKVNGRVQRVMSGTQLRDMNLLNGTTYDCDGVPNTAPGVSFPIFFAEPWRKDARDQDALAWSSRGWQSFQIEVDFGAADDATLVAHAVTDNFAPEKPAGICKWTRHSVGVTGTSFDWTTLDRRDWLQQLSLSHASSTAGTYTKVTVKKDGEILHELTKSANSALLLQHGMTPAASGRSTLYDIVFDHDDLLGSAVNLDGSRDLVISAETTSMAGQVTVIAQRLGLPD
jgi:hypothetical protein